MSTPFFSDSEMAALRSVAEQTMQTSIAIWRRTTEQTDSGQRSVYALSSTVLGWINSTPTPVITLVSGSEAVVNTFRLYVPIGTDILPGDHAVVGAFTYVVSDTTTESTWQAMLRVSLRLAE